MSLASYQTAPPRDKCLSHSSTLRLAGSQGRENDYDRKVSWPTGDR